MVDGKQSTSTVDINSRHQQSTSTVDINSRQQAVDSVASSSGFARACFLLYSFDSVYVERNVYSAWQKNIHQQSIKYFKENQNI